MLAFEKAGADVLYAPWLADLETVQHICANLNKPFNVLAAGKFSAIRSAQFAAAGVARISLGGALARVTHKAIYDYLRLCNTDVDNGDFSGLAAAADGDKIDTLLKRGKPLSLGRRKNMTPLDGGALPPAANRSTLAIMRDFMPYLWPAGDKATKRRVSLAVALMTLQKVATVSVPLIYGVAVDLVADTQLPLPRFWPFLSLCGGALGTADL